MKESLFADMVAHPADDDPRLVWADAEGGERGELVVIQCALAKGSPSTRGAEALRAERRKLYARERALLEKPWPEAEGLTEPRFERGFITHAKLKLAELPPALARHPLLTSIELSDVGVKVDADTVIPPWDDYAALLGRVFGDLAPGRITHLSANPHDISGADVPRSENRAERFLETLATTRAARALRSLSFRSGMMSHTAMSNFDGWTELEELHAYFPPPYSSFAHFVTALPRVKRLAIPVYRADIDPEPLLRTLTHAQVGGGLYSDENYALAKMMLPNMRAIDLGLAPRRSTELRALLESDAIANLETLTVGWIDDVMLEWIAGAPFAPTLRELNLDATKITAKSIPRLRDAFPELDRLDLRNWNKWKPGGKEDMSAFAPLAKTIPQVRL